ncbi:MAG: ABC transporter permease [Spirochaetia bacterium]|nr:ABC transporter permease [Spirochaetia bacterium]
MIKGVFSLYRDRAPFFLELLAQHALITLISISIITVVGFCLGLLMTKHKLIAGILLRLTSFLYTIPSIALFGILVSITGIGMKSAVIAIVLYGLLPMIRSTYTSLVEVPADIIEAAVGMGTAKGQLLVNIRLPLALPVIFSGFRTTVVMTIALTGIASFIGAGGMGRAVWRGISTNYPEMTIAGSFLIALMAILSDLVLEFVERRVRIRFLGEEGVST